MVVMRGVAKSYAEAGIRVLPLYPVLRPGVCACPNGEACGRSAGKHPLINIVPHGVLQATADWEDIDGSWPIDGYNLGVALSQELLAIDIDDTNVWNELLKVMPPDLVVGLSGKGGHVYVRPTVPTRACLLRTADGRRLGELRGTGQYTVIPPSTHYTGVEYRWLNKGLLDGLPHYQGNAYDFATELLARVGVKLRPLKELGPDMVYGGTVNEAVLPFEVPLDQMFIRQMLTGTFPTNDRSGTLFHFACELVRCARGLKVELPADTLAGVIKQVDANWKHPKGPKYASRGAAGDPLIWDAAVRAIDEVAVEQDAAEREVARLRTIKPSTEVLEQPELSKVEGTDQAADDAMVLDDTPVTPGGSLTYRWTPGVGFVDFSSPKKPVRIANFEPLIEEELEVWDGDEQRGLDWTLRFKNAEDQVVSLRLRESDRESVVAFRRAVEPKLPTHFIVEDGMWGRLVAAMRWYSMTQVKRRVSYMSPGWIPGKDAFLLPGAPGAITATGFDESLRFENPDTPPRFMRYGQHVDARPKDRAYDTTAVFRSLYAPAPPRVSVPLMAQVFGATVISLGGIESPAVIHLLGRTGSFKTGLCYIALSVFGEFHTGEGRTDSWTGTPYALQLSLNILRDLPLVIDDYKVASVKADMTQFIQNYADRTARIRATRDQKQQGYAVARANLITTGEDIWEGQESVDARTFVLPMDRSLMNYEALVAARDVARRGDYGVLGYGWLRWLCRMGRDNVRAKVKALRLATLAEVQESPLGREHPRSVESASSLLAVDRLMREFIAEVAPGFSAEYVALSDEGWREALSGLTEAAVESRENAPYEALKRAIVAALATAGGSLHPYAKDGRTIIGAQGAPPLGQFDDNFVYLSREITWAWYLHWLRSQGLNPTFSWRSFRADSRGKGAEVADNPRIVPSLDQRIRYIRLPITEFFAPSTV